MALNRKHLAASMLRRILHLELLCWLSTCVQGGAWSSWSDWQCPPNGSYATRNRRYTCVVNETTNCDALDIQFQSSPIILDWSVWSPWSPPCNTTYQTRNRSCVIPPINFDLSTTAVCFNCGNRSQVVSQSQVVPQTSCCQVIYQWSQWSQWTGNPCSALANRSRQCIPTSSPTVPGSTTNCQLCLPSSFQFQSGDPSADSCAPTASPSLLLPLLLSLLLLTLACGTLGVLFFALCLREAKLHRTYKLRNWEIQRQLSNFSSNSWQDRATHPPNVSLEMLPRNTSAHYFDIKPSEPHRRNAEEGVANGNPQTTGRTPGRGTGADHTPLRVLAGDDSLLHDDEGAYHVVPDTKALVHRDLTDSGEGNEMASFSSPLYEHSDEEYDGDGREEYEVTVI